jgi:membrane-bound serine protease (ClpP class)
VDTLLDEPAVVLVLLSLAAVLFVVEVALPTLGVAGTLSLLLGTAAAVGLAHQDADWWPLLGPVAAVVLWAVMIARRSRTIAEQATAVSLFTGGGVLFGVAEHDLTTVFVAVLGGVIVAVDFRYLHDRALRLLQQPPQVGMEALVGRTAEVVRWDDEARTVRIGGSLWNAAGAETLIGLRPGLEVEVIGTAGMTVTVAEKVNH